MDHPDPQRVTLKTIAQKAGVSVATVSLALGNRPQVAEATRLRVRALADELGYRPDPALQALSAYRSKGKKPRTGVGNLAYLYGRERIEDLRSHPFMSQHLAGAERRAEELGCSLDLVGISNLKGQQLERTLESRGIQGVVVASFPYAEEDIGLTPGKFHSVALMQVPPGSASTRVVASPSGGCRIVAERLQSLGYQRAGLVIPEIVSKMSHHEWEVGFGAVTMALGGGEDIPILRTRQRHGEDEILRWGRRWEIDAAVLLFGRPSAERLRAAAAEAGWTPGFCCLDLPAMEGPFAGLFQNRPALGAACIDALHAAIIQDRPRIPTSPTSYEILPAWHDGTSLPAKDDPRS